MQIIGLSKFDDMSTPVNVLSKSQQQRLQKEQFSTNNDNLNIACIDVRQMVIFLLMLLTKPKKKIKNTQRNKQTIHLRSINIKSIYCFLVHHSNKMI